MAIKNLHARQALGAITALALAGGSATALTTRRPIPSLSWQSPTKVEPRT